MLLLHTRRSATVAGITNKGELEKASRTAFYGGTIEKYFTDKFGFNCSLIPDELLIEHGFSDGLDSVVKTNEDKQSLYLLTQLYSNEIINSAKKESALLSQYYKDMGLYNKERNVAVVDIGYAGSMQSAMCKIIDRDVGGVLFYDL
jgi:hypothetical protein